MAVVRERSKCSLCFFFTHLAVWWLPLELRKYYVCSVDVLWLQLCVVWGCECSVQSNHWRCFVRLLLIFTLTTIYFDWSLVGCLCNSVNFLLHCCWVDQVVFRFVLFSLRFFFCLLFCVVNSVVFGGLYKLLYMHTHARAFLADAFHVIFREVFSSWFPNSFGTVRQALITGHAQNTLHLSN